ncbi:MAG: GntR family transcriptional regulator, partial [Micromonosporaceae bacterium]
SQLLPSETTLMNEFGVARGTVREAIAVLRAEGLVVTEHGRGTYARPVLPIRRIGSDRYRREIEQLTGENPPATSFIHDHATDWAAYQLDKDFREVPATPAVAELFGVEPGTMLLERQFLFRIHGVPQQLSTSCYPLTLVNGTPVADPDNEPWPGGNIAQLHSLGITATRIREQVRARMPLEDEVQALRIPSGVPVLAVTRRTYAGDEVVEVAVDIVLPADRTELEYDIPLQ